MSLKEQFDALALLKPGWNGDTQYESQVPNSATIAYAKRLAQVLPLPPNVDPLDINAGGWTAGPMADGSILLKSGNIGIAVAVLEESQNLATSQ